MNRDLASLEEKIGYVFQDKSLLQNSLLHRSYGNENWRFKHINNERLELLGDAVLDLIVAEYLYKNFVNSSEGELAKIKSMVVSEPVLARISRGLGIGDYLLLSKGEEMTGGRTRNSILGDSFEAILGAIYLDSGLEKSKDMALKHMKYWIDHVNENDEISDYKTILQEYTQKERKIVPTYELVKESGPDHLKSFEIRVNIGTGIYGEGFGKNKKLAEQIAAKDLLRKLGQKVHEAL